MQTAHPVRRSGRILSRQAVQGQKQLAPQVISLDQAAPRFFMVGKGQLGQALKGRGLFVKFRERPGNFRPAAQHKPGEGVGQGEAKASLAVQADGCFGRTQGIAVQHRIQREKGGGAVRHIVR